MGLSNSIIKNTVENKKLITQNIDVNTNIYKLNTLINKIEGIENINASPIDTWIVQFNDYVTYNYQHIKYGSLKIFIEKNNDIDLINHEIEIYKNIIKPLLRYNICSNFINSLCCIKNCNYKDLVNILIGKIGNLNKNNIIKNLNNNLYYIRNKKNFKHAIDSKKYNSFKKTPECEKYNIFLTEDKSKNSINLGAWIMKHFKDIDFEDNFWNILFQICFACYTMSLSKLIHNDMHIGNILIENLENKQIYLYYINGIQFIIKTQYKAIICNFNKSYIVENNENNENIDILKIFCSIIRLLLRFLNNDKFIQKITNLLTNNESSLQELLNIYYYDEFSCFLKTGERSFLGYVLNNKVITPIYKDYNDYCIILQSIYNYIENKQINNVIFNDIYYLNKNCFDNIGKLQIENYENKRRQELDSIDILYKIDF